MCGIFASVSFINHDTCKQLPSYDELQGLKSSLQRRGPNYFQTVSTVYKDNFHLCFCAAVLHLRGSSLTEQPIGYQEKNFLLWNGEIFGGPLYTLESDTKVLAERLYSSRNSDEVLQIISSIEGPYAFIFYQDDGLLWFGRDAFGRRSLLWKMENFQFSLCSTGIKQTKWEEVSSSGIFCLDLNLASTDGNFIIHHYLWSSSASGDSQSLCKNLQGVQIKVHPDMHLNIPVVQKLNKNVPPDAVSTEILFALNALQSNELTTKQQFQKILKLKAFYDAVNDLETVLSEAVRKRVINELGFCKMCYKERMNDCICDHSSVAVLFSGGLDSIVIACLANRHLAKNKTIDLINVAFSNSTDFQSQSKDMSHNTPDRITGKSGIKELTDIHPSRIWNFVEVNISKEELVLERQNSISHLLSPSCTVLDDSIGCALWFAARGKGILNKNGFKQDYTSLARVMLVGMGADEQLAGYSRHRAKFNNDGWVGLIKEISFDIDRIGSRNMGRDDRIIADHGVESRYPFLDENVVSFLNGLPVWLKVNLNLPRGIGEKLLLRLLAYKLGLTEAASLPKRAIQFGSRIAKIENSKEKGSDVCERLAAINC